MKRFFLSALATMLVAAFATQVEAQNDRPAPSPFGMVKQVVGLTEVTVEYSRPGVKGRTIFGEESDKALVPYGKMWRTGANAATKISFNKAVKVGGQELAAGDYALFTKPGAEEWEVMLFEHTTTSAGGYGNATPAASFKVPVQQIPEGMNIERFTIMVMDMTDTSAAILLVWDNVMVALPLEV